MIATCAVIARDSSIAQTYRSVARRFLDRLDPTWILLLGMMADASDEILHLVRFFDKEAFEVDAMASAVAQVKDTLQALFQGKACLRTGFTRLCLEHLRTPKLVPRSDGTLRSVGGPRAGTTSLAQGCLRRMEAWAAVVLEVIKTEFPDWELLAAFGVSSWLTGRSRHWRGCPRVRHHRVLDLGPGSVWAPSHANSACFLASSRMSSKITTGSLKPRRTSTRSSRPCRRGRQHWRRPHRGGPGKTGHLERCFQSRSGTLCAPAPRQELNRRSAGSSVAKGSSGTRQSSLRNGSSF